MSSRRAKHRAAPVLWAYLAFCPAAAMKIRGMQPRAQSQARI
jgi:hypothetical protein